MIFASGFVNKTQGISRVHFFFATLSESLTPILMKVWIYRIYNIFFLRTKLITYDLDQNHYPEKYLCVLEVYDFFVVDVVV